jgi:hypothetical protein
VWPALLLATSLASPSPIAKLADAFADAIVAVANGRPVELEAPLDRSGRGAAVALDLRSLTLERLQGRLPPATAGARLRLSPVLAEVADRLVVSARVVLDPPGTLLDVVSVSVALDARGLDLAAAPPAAGHVVDVVSNQRSPSLDACPLDLALTADSRLLVLYPDSVALYRLEGGALSIDSRALLPGPFSAVRAVAGLLRVADADSWVMTNRGEKALLFGLEGGRLTLRQRADALPWPGIAAGVHYRPGTNLLVAGEAALARVAEGDWAVADDGSLWLDGHADANVRIGSALAPLWEGFAIASSASLPGHDDALVIVERRAGAAQIVDTLNIEGVVAALGARVNGRNARVVAAISMGRATQLVVLDIRLRDGEP